MIDLPALRERLLAPIETSQLAPVQNPEQYGLQDFRGYEHQSFVSDMENPFILYSQSHFPEDKTSAAIVEHHILLRNLQSQSTKRITAALENLVPEKSAPGFIYSLARKDISNLIASLFEIYTSPFTFILFQETAQKIELWNLNKVYLKRIGIGLRENMFTDISYWPSLMNQTSFSLFLPDETK